MLQPRMGSACQGLGNKSGLLCTGTNRVRPIPVLCYDLPARRKRVPGDSTNDDREGKATIQPMEKAMKTPKIPHTDSIEALARFWDEHDLIDFEDQLEEVREPVFERKPEGVIPIRLQPEELKAVKRLAKVRGIGQVALLRQWVLEKLRDTELAVKRR